MSLHMTAPNTKLRRTCPIKVNGMQNTPRSRSDTAWNE